MGFSSARNLGRDISAGFSPPRRMPISEAVKKFMRVPKGAGNSVPWDPELTPYIIEPMNCLASREYDAVIFVGPARTGKTIGLIDGWIVYTIVCDPSDMLVVQMTKDKAREHSKKRLDRTFRSSAAVKKRMSPRRNDNNVHDKTFRDGSFLKIGWPSVNIMSSSDYRFVALTDYDRFPENIDSEGDGFSLASKRTTTFMSAGMTLVESSPGRDICDSKWRRKSPHEAPPTTGILSLYNRGDRRRWYWSCPHCGEYFQPAMDAMTGYRNEPDPFKASEAAYLLCPHCSGIITAEKKRELNSAGVWLREGQVIDRNGNVSGEPRRSRIAPPDIPAGFVAVFNSDEASWHLVEDHRGKTVYDVASGDALFISELGPLPENVTWLSPEGEFQKWNGTAWVKDTEAEKLFRIREAEETKNNLMQVASEHIAPLQDAADLEIATEEEISLLEAWKKYRVLLNRVDTSTAQDIEWPALP
ncbi:TPA: hypothetical protein H5W55_002712 [Escherichia coli]|nr:hypothetical protein [Escherichia coli]HAL1660946.1 hypothetical protein [Escherichia coli]HAL7104424.1 hypothetical protein [Escherichia coli]